MYDRDRAAGVAGVELSDGEAAGKREAGKEWGWHWVFRTVQELLGHRDVELDHDLHPCAQSRRPAGPKPAGHDFGRFQPLSGGMFEGATTKCRTFGSNSRRKP